MNSTSFRGNVFALFWMVNKWKEHVVHTHNHFLRRTTTCEGQKSIKVLVIMSVHKFVRKCISVRNSWVTTDTSHTQWTQYWWCSRSGASWLIYSQLLIVVVCVWFMCDKMWSMKCLPFIRTSLLKKSLKTKKKRRLKTKKLTSGNCKMTVCDLA